MEDEIKTYRWYGKEEEGPIALKCRICMKSTKLYIPYSMCPNINDADCGVICDSCAAKIRNLIFEGDNDLR